MSPQEMKELPKDEQDDENEVGVLVSDDEDITGDEPEPPEELDPELVDIEVEEVDDIPQVAEEDHADDEEEEDDDEEEDVDDDEDDDSSEGRKEKDDDSDDEDDDKGPFNDSDDEDEMDNDNDEDSDEDESANGCSAVRKGRITAKRNTFSKGKVMPGVSFPLTTNPGYKGDIEDLIRAAAQAEEGETSTGQENLEDLDHRDHKDDVPKITIKVATDDIECEVVNVIEVENNIEEVDDKDEEGVDNSFNVLDIEKRPLLKETYTLGDGEDPPHKRMKNS